MTSAILSHPASDSSPVSYPPNEAQPRPGMLPSPGAGASFQVLCAGVFVEHGPAEHAEGCTWPRSGNRDASHGLSPQCLARTVREWRLDR